MTLAERIYYAIANRPAAKRSFIYREDQRLVEAQTAATLRLLRTPLNLTLDGGWDDPAERQPQEVEPGDRVTDLRLGRTWVYVGGGWEEDL